MANIPASLPTRGVVLVLGANGRFGRAAVDAFDAAGWRVLAQLRRAPAAALPAQVTPLRVALDDTVALTAALASASRDDATAGRDADGSRRVVIHAVNPVYTRWDEEALPALQAGLHVAQGTGAHFMLPGNVYGFGAAMPPVLTEDTPETPSTRKGSLRVEMERRIEQAARDGGFTASVVRAGDFLGPGRGTWLDQLITRRIAAGRLVYPGPLDCPHAWAYLPDLARAFVDVASVAAPETYRTWHHHGYTLTGAQLLDAITTAARALGVAPAGGFRIGGMPWRLVAAVGVVHPLWRELARMAYLWRVPHSLDGRRLDALRNAASPPTPLADALRACLAAQLAPVHEDVSR